mgnify:CR=1 FL=1
MSKKKTRHLLAACNRDTDVFNTIVFNTQTQKYSWGGKTATCVEALSNEPSDYTYNGTPIAVGSTRKYLLGWLKGDERFTKIVMG